MSDVNPDQTVEQFLAEENRRLRKAGCKLAEAALHVAREYDGIHRLLLAVSEWSAALANEGGRSVSKSTKVDIGKSDTDLYRIFTIRSRNAEDLHLHRIRMREMGWNVGPIELGDPNFAEQVGKFVFVAKIRKDRLSEKDLEELAEWDRQQGE